MALGMYDESSVLPLLGHRKLIATAAIAAGAWATAAYLDAKYHLRKDVGVLLQQKLVERAYHKRVAADRVNVWYLVEESCLRHWDKRAIWFEGQTWTFGEFYDQVLRYAQWMLDEGIRPRELVGIYLMNSPEFMICWFAALCIGAAPAFLNYNLEGKALMHCIDICETKLIIVDEDADCRRRMEASRNLIEANGAKIAVLDQDLKAKITARPAVRPGNECRDGTLGSWNYCIIYTSGTTGLPKGCGYPQGRCHLNGAHIYPRFGGKPGHDVWYNSMPLYHGTGAVAASSALLGGIAIAIGRKFSVSRFWNEIYASNATLFVYVGETARYLLNAPVHPLEQKHRIRTCFGNGLRPDVWAKFQERFNIPSIAEFFSSTEGLFTVLIWDKGPFFQGCVGHHGLILRQRYSETFVPVAIDHETGDIWRDPATGFAKRMPYEEGGEIIVKVPSRQAFSGYWRNPTATEKRFATDVFRQGDLWYRCGDSLCRDTDGKWFFLDRLGDTFRWKSENVSTAEVSECLGRYPGIAEANVYGVLVPNTEGRAGCAAIQLAEGHGSSTFDYEALLRYLRQRLPRYAVPVFLRVVKSSIHIHNHKQNKVPLRKEGVDPRLIGTEVVDGRDDLFLWLSPAANSYVPFQKEDWRSLETSQARL
jgi:acyl-CoA synthetase (AMP-forming)/AMP-acid ligase II